LKKGAPESSSDGGLTISFHSGCVKVEDSRSNVLGIWCERQGNEMAELAQALSGWYGNKSLGRSKANEESGNPETQVCPGALQFSVRV
jgi:hypothetical protein